MNQQKILNSALWAAFGDALGFVTELGDEKLVQYRLHGQDDAWGKSVWRRRIGGRYGVEIPLPAGTYSDDTQLRLAVSRSITGNGIFQREAFAKIELPVWRAYSLGAGIGSLAAAENLIKSGTNWHSNQFITKDANYYKGGGNGAAMRIQPHIWAAADLRYPNSYLLDVLANAIITHGHGRGILGAAFHAICLASTMTNGSPINPKLWREAIQFLDNVPSIFEKELEISSIWMQQWQADTKENFKTHVSTVVKEFLETIQAFDEAAIGSPVQRYENFAKKINAVGSKEVGSGVKTSLLAMVAAYLFRDEDPLLCIKTVAGVLHSDTDTIATMAGALIGTFLEEEPPYPIQDYDYIKSEAIRLTQISKKERPASFFYPNVVSWRVIRSPLEQIAVVNDDSYLAGLGKLVFDVEKYSNKTTRWSWATLPFGQRILIKQHNDIIKSKIIPPIGEYSPTKEHKMNLHSSNDKHENMYPANISNEIRKNENLLSSFYINTQRSSYLNKSIFSNRDTETIMTDIVKSKFDPTQIGNIIISMLADDRFVQASELLIFLYKKYSLQKNKKDSG